MKLAPEEKILKRFFLEEPSSSLENLEKLSGLTKNQVKIHLNSMLIKGCLGKKELREKIYQKILKIQRWRRKPKEKEYVKLLLESFSLEKLKILFKLLFFELSEPKLTETEDLKKILKILVELRNGWAEKLLEKPMPKKGI